MISIEIVGGNWWQKRKIKSNLLEKLKLVKNCRIITIKGSSSINIGQTKQSPFLRICWQKNDNLYSIVSNLSQEEEKYGIHIMPMALDLEKGEAAYLAA